MSPSVAQKAGMKPSPFRMLMAAAGGVNPSFPYASAKSCSGLKMWMIPISLSVFRVEEV
jgi:hypothetical protein